MENKYKTPKIDTQNVVSFTCSDNALESVIELLENMRALGSMGCSRNIVVEWGGKHNTDIFFDGDGSAKLNNITINGLSQDEWRKEWDRLEEVRKYFGNENDSEFNEDEIGIFSEDEESSNNESDIDPF